MARRELTHAGEERLLEMIGVTLREKVADRRGIGTRPEGRVAEKCPRLAREGEPIALDAEHERLDPEAVARAEEPPAATVPERKRPHAVEVLDAGRPPLLVRAQHDLGVRLGAEAMAELLELRAKLEVVEDLAVVQELQRAVVARERLAAAVGEVDNRESRMPERDSRRLEEALAVRPAVTELGEHRADNLRLRWPIERRHPADAAHQSPQARCRADACASALNAASASVRALRRIASTRLRSAASSAATEPIPPAP